MGLIEAERGAAAVEFALVAPLLLALVSGVAGLGGRMWLSHEMQQAANEAVRATRAGLDAAERGVLAREALDRQLAAGGMLVAERVDLSLRERAEMVTVTIVYDMRDSPFAALPLAGDGPLRRSATARVEQP